MLDDRTSCDFNEIKFVKPDEYRVANCGVIYTVLGTCIAVLLWDKKNHIGGLAHYRIGKKPLNKGSYISGEELLERMYEEMIKAGADSSFITANLIGGMDTGREIASKIVDDNIETALKFLSKNGIELKNRKTGFNFPLRIRFYLEDGRVTIQKIEYGEEKE